MPDEFQDQDVLFEALTPLGFWVRTTSSYWRFIITVKHPAMADRETDVQAALATPAEVRQSRKDPTVYLFYKGDDRSRWVCAVVKRLNDNGFLITAYRTDKIKEGVRIWPR